jgi:hypothetical protein
MLLGDLLSAARRSAGAFQVWLNESDPELADRVVAAAGRVCLTAAGFMRSAVADFSRLASEEDWATLVSSMRDDQDPGRVCLLAMIHWRLAVRGCDDHSFYPNTQHGGAADERSEKRRAR